MSNDTEETISIITYEEVDLSGDLKSRRRALEPEERTEEELEPIKWEYLRKHDVPISTIEAELQKLVTQMNRILPRLKSEETAEPSFALHEIALHVEINAEGNLSILGTGGKLGGKGGMQLTFKRS
jgi:hypothetical protein